MVNFVSIVRDSLFFVFYRLYLLLSVKAKIEEQEEQIKRERKEF